MLDAVQSALIAEGLEGLSVRKVAAQAGVSIGAVQHHFSTRDAMLHAVLDRGAQRVEAALNDQITTELWPRRLTRVAAALLSVDHRELQRPCHSRRARAAVTRTPRDAPHRLARNPGETVAASDRQGRSGCGSRAAAIELPALLDGLACAVAVEPDRVRAAYAETIVRRHIERLVEEKG